jgi:mRNA interferase RelE/StbE
VIAVAAALQIWSATYSKAFDDLPASVRESVQRKVDDTGTRLPSVSHQRLRGRSEYKLRVGDYLVIYEFDPGLGRLYLHYIGHRRDIYKKS